MKQDVSTVFINIWLVCCSRGWRGQRGADCMGTPDVSQNTQERGRDYRRQKDLIEERQVHTILKNCLRTSFGIHMAVKFVSLVSHEPSRCQLGQSTVSDISRARYASRAIRRIQR
jgi:hypothetical protein